jgi:hypothetical protein
MMSTNSLPLANFDMRPPTADAPLRRGDVI